MKVAFVNQPTDLILPPYQTSIGFCTYGVVYPLSQSCEVMVYGKEDIGHYTKQSGAFEDQGVQFRFLKANAIDKGIFKVMRRFPELTRLTNWGTRLPSSVSRWQFPGLGHQIAQALAQQQCDIIHVQHSSQYLPVIRAFNPNAKIVFHLHAELFPQCSLPTLARRMRHADLISSVSDYIKHKNRLQFPQFADRCCTFYNGIDPQEFDRKKDYASPRPRKRILYAGAVSPHKGIHTLIDAFNLVVDRYPEVELDIVGAQANYPIDENFALSDRTTIAKMQPFNRDYMGQLRDRISSAAADKVKFAGVVSREDLIDRFYGADVFAFTPIWDEGFGIPPVEAMAARTPVVATRSGAIVETVVDGETGFLVDKEDAIATANAIVQLLKNDSLRASMGNAGRQRVMDRFTWSHIAETMLHQYENLLHPQTIPQSLRIPSPR